MLHFLQLLGSLYQRGRCFAAAEHCYRQALVRAEGNQALVLMKMCKFALDAAASVSEVPRRLSYLLLFRKIFQCIPVQLLVIPVVQVPSHEHAENCDANWIIKYSFEQM